MARLSLTARLTLLFALGSSAVLLVLGWLVGIAVNHHFEQQDFDALVGKVQLAQHAIERVASKNELEALAQSAAGRTDRPPGSGRRGSSARTARYCCRRPVSSFPQSAWPWRPPG